MATLKVLQLVILLISYCSGADNPPCRPTVKDVSFTQFMESRSCEVDEKLLKLFSSEEFNNSIVNNLYANFMCIGLMDALALVPDDICDFDPLSDIPDGDFCSSAKIAYMQKIVNANVFDNTSNIFVVSKFTGENCKVVCENSNQLCWAFGIIAKAVLKHLSTQAPTTTTTTTTSTPTTNTAPPLPPLITGTSDIHSHDSPNNSSEGDVDNGDGDGKGENSDHTDKPEPPAVTATATDGGIARYYKVSNSSNESPSTKNNEEDGHEDNENKGTTADPGNDTDNNHTNPLSESNGDGNQTVNSTKEAGVTEQPGVTEDPGVTEQQGGVTEQPGVTEQQGGGTDQQGGGTEDYENLVEDQGHYGENTTDSTPQDDHGVGSNPTDHSTDQGADSNNDDSSEQNSDHSDADFGNTIGNDDAYDDDDDDGYSYWHFAAILLFILFLGVAGYLASLNRKKVNTTVVLLYVICCMAGFEGENLSFMKIYP